MGQVIILFRICVTKMFRNVSENTKAFSWPFKLKNRSSHFNLKRLSRILSILAFL